MDGGRNLSILLISSLLPPESIIPTTGGSAYVPEGGTPKGITNSYKLSDAGAISGAPLEADTRP